MEFDVPEPEPERKKARVRQLRTLASVALEKPMSQRECAELCGQSERTWQRYEWGERSISEEILAVFCEKAKIHFWPGMLLDAAPLRLEADLHGATSQYPEQSHTSEFLLVTCAQTGQKKMIRVDAIAEVSLGKMPDTRVPATHVHLISGRDIYCREALKDFVKKFGPMEF
jgi:transcriptional regulator with XRE-family HTH domain